MDADARAVEMGREMITDIFNDTLKPCPFCGEPISIAEVQFDKFGVGRLKIECCMDFDIFADGLIYSDGKRGYVRVGRDAVEKWNRRAGGQE